MLLRRTKSGFNLFVGHVKLEDSHGNPVDFCSKTLESIFSVGRFESQNGIVTRSPTYFTNTHFSQEGGWFLVLSYSFFYYLPKNN